MRYSSLFIVAISILLMMQSCDQSTKKNTPSTTVSLSTPESNQEENIEITKDTATGDTDKVHIKDDQRKDHEKSVEIARTTTIQETKPERAPVISAPIEKIPKSSDIRNKDKKKTKAKVLVNKKLPKIEFDELYYDFGEIVEGDIVKHDFKFTNTGEKPLKIISANASCGCTTPTIPFLDIAPGEMGFIGATFNSVNKEGVQRPEISIVTNAQPKSYTLRFVGKVLPDEETKARRDSIREASKKDTLREG